ncbi:hypothetical protein [Cellulomonas sp. Y8]|uniref:hypothetical protein n=1 Tax=Cellulomonas sp. Y8 TaxID=2591145 RepID=UPI003D74AA54
MRTTKTMRAAAAALVLVAVTACGGTGEAGRSDVPSPPATSAPHDHDDHDDDHEHSQHEHEHGRWDLEPWPGQDTTAGVVVDEQWLRAVLTWQAGDQTWAQVTDRAAWMLGPDAYVEVLVTPVFDAAIRDVTARHGHSRVSEVVDVTDPQAYEPGSGARVLAARVEFAGAGGWSRPALSVVAEVHTAGEQVVAVLIGEGSVVAEVGS